MKIGTRLGLSFALVLLLLTMVTALGLQQMTQFQMRLDQITGVNNVKVKLAMAMRDSVFERLIALRNLALGGSVSEMQDEAQRIKQEAQRYSEIEQKLKLKIDASSSAAKQEGALLLELKRFETAATPLIDKATGLAQASQVDQAYTVLTKELLPLQHKWMAQLDALIAFEDRQSDLSTSDARSAYGAARASILSIGALAVVIGALIAFLLTRKLVRQLGGEPDYAVRIVGQIAAGDLTVHIDLKPHDRASLLFAMKSMRDNLATMVGNLRSDSNAIVAMSSEISAGNADLSSRTEQQASALERTASRMDNLTATVKYNVDHVRHANQLAASASGVALTGSAEVLRVVETMNSINASAKRIVDIIGVINGIAFQTNILALNAAVEASRAGEQGRGFAVVATEVRGLAQRSAEAAKEIKALIGDAVDKVDSGSTLADQAGATMDALAGSIKRVTDIMLEITAASNDQSAEIEQINQVIAQMDGVTQQNAALVEQAAAATERMQERALGLAGALQVFKVGSVPAPHGKDFWPAIENGQRPIA